MTFFFSFLLLTADLFCLCRVVKDEADSAAVQSTAEENTLEDEEVSPIENGQHSYVYLSVNLLPVS